MKRILLTLAIWLMVAFTLLGFGVVWLQSLTWYVACMDAQSDRYVMQQRFSSIHQNSTLLDLKVAAACGVKHGVSPAGVK